MKAFNQLKEAVAPKDPEPPKTPKNTQTSNTDTRTPTKSTKAPSKPTAMSTKKDEKTSYYPIVGILPGKGVHDKVPVRMEVDEWWDSKDPIHINQQSLLLQAFNKLYSMSPHDKLSFYQIAGKHNPDSGTKSFGN